jgi:tRNA 2-thiouridine synthesizing protein D
MAGQSMVISLVIHSSPVSDQGAQSAYRFCKAALEDGHQIYRLFFYDDGVCNSNTFTVMPQDEFDLPAAWAALIQEYELDAVSCVASALKRGILNAEESSRYERVGSNLNTAFDISGLGQWVDACVQSDRVVSFGV